MKQGLKEEKVVTMEHMQTIIIVAKFDNFVITL